jgi:hypothetical protein
MLAAMRPTAAANIDNLRYLAEILGDPRRFTDVDTTAQEIWMQWAAAIGEPRRRLTVPDAIRPLVEDLDRAIETLTSKHFRDPPAQAVARSDWPAIQIAAKRLRAALSARER